MIRTVIIDDEDHIRDTLKKLLAGHCPQVVVEGEAGGVESGIRLIREVKPDLVLLDIQLNDGLGFGILDEFLPLPFRVIFITAFDKYAVKAFRFSALDYLLKPVDPEELSAAVNRAAEQSPGAFMLQLKALEDNMRSLTRQRHKVILKTAEKIHLIETEQIVSCESSDNYTLFHLAGGERILVSRTLKEFEEMLAGQSFYRVHKSHLVNLAHIRQFEKQEGGFVILTGDHKVPVASRKREELLALIEKLAG